MAKSKGRSESLKKYIYIKMSIRIKKCQNNRDFQCIFSKLQMHFMYLYTFLKYQKKKKNPELPIAIMSEINSLKIFIRGVPFVWRFWTWGAVNSSAVRSYFG